MSASCLGVILTTIILCAPGQVLAQFVIQRHSLGALHLTLSLDRQSMAFADQLRLTLSLETPPDRVVVWPQLRGALGSFTIRSQRTLGPLATVGHTQQWQQEYTLVAETMEMATIPPLSVAVQAADPTANASPQQLITAAFAIPVTPLLPANASVMAPRDIAPPVVLVRPSLFPGPWKVAGVLACLALGAVAWWWYRRRTARNTHQRPAHVLALEALERLRMQQLLTPQHLDEFYVNLSYILRLYVARRFGLHALEQTSEEFLAAADVTGGVIRTHQPLLSTLLQHCDVVKFARYQPVWDDIQHDVERARTFVTQTAEARVVVPGTGVGS